MAATIKDSVEDTSKRKHIKAALVNKLEGCSDVVNMAVTIPHEDAVITVSDDKYVRSISFASRCFETSFRLFWSNF